MEGYLRRSRWWAAGGVVVIGLTLLAGGGCAQKVLTVVDGCPDGGILSGSGACVPPGLLYDLIGWWHLDDGTGSMIARDSSSRGNDGTLTSLEPANVWVPGRSGTGLDVAANGYVNVPDSMSIDTITEQVTIAGWGYLDAASAIMDYATIASREDGTGIDQHYHISFDMQLFPVCFIKADGGTPRLTQMTAAPRQTWIHIACTYDGSVAQLYVDGQPIGGLGMQALTGRFAADTTPFILGGNGNGPAMGVSERFPGRIDEIMLYRRALSAAEIAQLHNGALFAAGSVTDAGARE
jgi:hypothetical protein